MKRMKRKSYLYYIIAASCCVSMFSSCITKRQTAYLQQGNAAYAPVMHPEYRLRVNDEVSYFLITSDIETQTLYSGELSNYSGGRSVPFRIYDDGTVHLPIGQVKIAGLTLHEAEDLLRNTFARLVPDAEIRLTMVNNTFYVMGDQGKGGQFQIYKENMNIFQALALAGDISNMGDKKNVKIVRKGADGLDYIYSFDLRDESIIESEYYYIMPNDVIYIPTNPNAFFRIDSVSSFVSLFIAPVSLFVMILTLFK